MHFLSTERSIINVETEVRIYTVVVKRVAARRDRKKLRVEWKKIWDGVPNMFWRGGGCRCHSARYGNVRIQGFYSCKKYQ